MATGPINRAPRGLLDQLRLKVGGKTPQQFGEELQPTLETFPWYSSDTLRMATSSQPSSATTQAELGSIPITVPSDEAWVIHSINWTAISDQATAQECLFSGALRLSVPGGTALMMLGTSAWRAGAGETGGAGIPWVPGAPFILTPDSEITTYRWEAITGAVAIEYQQHVCYSPFKT